MTAADAPLAAALLALPGARGLGDLLVPEALLRRFVATVDNLPRHHLAAEQRPLKPTPGAFLTVGDDLAGSADARNAARYAPALKVLLSVDPNALYRLYRHWYPLLQQAYQGLGYPAAISTTGWLRRSTTCSLRRAPAVPPELKGPNVLWVYADEELEARSAGQRLLLRLPAAQAQQLRVRLQALRDLLVAGPPPATGTARGSVERLQRGLLSRLAGEYWSVSTRACSSQSARVVNNSSTSAVVKPNGRERRFVLRGGRAHLRQRWQAAHAREDHAVAVAAGCRTRRTPSRM